MIFDLICQDDDACRYHYDSWANRRWLTLIAEILRPLYRVALQELPEAEIPFVEYRCDYDILKNGYVFKAELK